MNRLQNELVEGMNDFSSGHNSGFLYAGDADHPTLMIEAIKHDGNYSDKSTVNELCGYYAHILAEYPWEMACQRVHMYYVLK